MSNQLLVQLLTQPHLPSETSRTVGATSSKSDKYVLNVQPNCTMMSKVQLEQAIDVNTNALQKDMHEQRLKNLSKLVKEIEETDWQYEPVENLIGFSSEYTEEDASSRIRNQDYGEAPAVSLQHSPGGNYRLYISF